MLVGYNDSSVGLFAELEVNEAQTGFFLADFSFGNICFLLLLVMLETTILVES